MLQGLGEGCSVPQFPSLSGRMRNPLLQPLSPALGLGEAVVCLWKSRAGTQHPSHGGTSRVGAQGSVQLCSPSPSRAQG